jgi:hypothetical protein
MIKAFVERMDLECGLGLAGSGLEGSPKVRWPRVGLEKALEKGDDVLLLLVEAIAERDREHDGLSIALFSSQSWVWLFLEAGTMAKPEFTPVVPHRVKLTVTTSP